MLELRMIGGLPEMGRGLVFLEECWQLGRWGPRHHSKNVASLYRTVVGKFQWKLNRWPFQKTVSIEFKIFNVECVRPWSRAFDILGNILTFIAVGWWEMHAIFILQYFGAVLDANVSLIEITMSAERPNSNMFLLVCWFTMITSGPFSGGPSGSLLSA